MPKLNNQYIAEQAKPWSSEKRASFAADRSRYNQQMVGETARWISKKRKEHTRKDKSALAAVRAEISQLM